MSHYEFTSEAIEQRRLYNYYHAKHIRQLAERIVTFMTNTFDIYMTRQDITDRLRCTIGDFNEAIASHIVIDNGKWQLKK
jgi:hypothetical protein